MNNNIYVHSTNITIKVNQPTSIIINQLFSEAYLSTQRYESSNVVGIKKNVGNDKL